MYLHKKLETIVILLQLCIILLAFQCSTAVAVLQVHSLLLRMLVAGLDQHLVSSVISLSHSVVPHTLILSDLITEALSTSLTQLKYVVCPVSVST